MNDVPIIEYRGFQAKPLVREYMFSVREVGMGPREYTLTILNEAFESHRARYQDAPDICSLRLHRELSASANDPLKTHFRITDAELDDYRDSHAPRATRNLYPRKTAQDQ